MIKKIWWALKVFLFPHLDRRAARRPSKIKETDEMLKTAIINLGKAIQEKK